MARRNPDLSYALGLSARDAAAYLDSLGVKPTTSWHDLIENERAAAFTVAQMTKLDLLTDVWNVLRVSAKEGMTGWEFRKILEPELAKKGWTGKRKVIDKKTGAEKEAGADLPARLNLIFFQNMQSAYMAGRYRAQLANAENRPWWMYVAVLDSRTRPAHAALNGKVFRYDDPFWSKFYPPNGFYCRCTVRSLDDEDLERMGKKPESSEGMLVSHEVVLNPRAPESEWKTVEQWGYQQSKNGPTFWAQPGFAWSPGYATWGVDHALAQKLDYLKKDKLYAEFVQFINDSKARHKAFAAWMANFLATKKPKGEAAVIGLVQPEVIKKAESEGLNPARIAVVTEGKIMHSLGGKHEMDSMNLSDEQYKNLAKSFYRPEAIYWEKNTKRAIYIFPDTDPDWCVFMVLDMPGKSAEIKNLGRLDGLVTVFRRPRKVVERMNLEKL